MPKKGFLTPKNYFPKNRDVLEDRDEGSTWTCVRGGQWVCPKTGTKIRFALLIEYHPELNGGDTPIAHTWHEYTNMSKALEEFDAIYRPRGSGAQTLMVEYLRQDSGTFLEL